MLLIALLDIKHILYVCFLATPGPPYALTVVDVTKRHVGLKWEAPKNDGGRPIQRLESRKIQIFESFTTKLYCNA